MTVEYVEELGGVIIWEDAPDPEPDAEGTAEGS